MARKGLRSYPNVTVLAGETVEMNIHGRYITAYEGTGEVKLQLDDGPFSVFFKGAEWVLSDEDSDFHTVRLRNDSGSAVTVSLYVGFGEVRDRRLSVSGALSLAGASLAAAADVTLTAATAGQIVAANVNRKELFLTNKTGAAVRIGDATDQPGATTGAEMPADATWIISTMAAVWGYSAGGGSMAVTESTS